MSVFHVLSSGGILFTIIWCKGVLAPALLVEVLLAAVGRLHIEDEHLVPCRYNILTNMIQYPDKHEKMNSGKDFIWPLTESVFTFFLVLKLGHFWWAVALLQIWGSTLRTNGMINDKQIFLIWGATAPLATRWLTQILRSNNRDYLVMIHRSSILNAHISGSISNTLESTMPARKHN